MNNEEKILSMLETLVTEQQKTSKRLDSVEYEVQAVKNTTMRLENEKIENLIIELQKTNQRLAGVEQEVQTVKNTTLRLENEHGKKLDALFDGYIQLYDISKEIREDITALKVLQEKQEISIKWIDSKRKAE